MQKSLFSIPDQDDHSPMVDSDYYAYLLENEKWNVHNILTKMKYLKGIGFDQEKQTLSSEDIHRLQCIEQHYTFNVLRPIWDADLKAKGLK